jgi:hypothetical protein
MSLKSAALIALVGTTLLTIVLAIIFLRDFSAFLSDAISLMALLNGGVRLVASLSLAVFLYVFHQAQP